MAARSDRSPTAVHPARVAAIRAAVLLALALAGCGSPVPLTTGSPTGPEPAPTLTALPAPTPPATPPATTSQAPGHGPPLASIIGFGDPVEAVPGTLGSWSWDDSGDAAPWIVPSASSAATPGALLTLVVDGGRVPESWVARWARLADGAAGGTADDPEAGTEGVGPARFGAPAEPGAWGLQVDTRFGDGRSAAWYWRVEVRR
jgi:hypothetical protein